MTKKITMLILFFCITVCAVLPYPVLAQYNDTPSSWAKNAVDYLQSYELIPDALLSSFTSNIRRDEFAAILISIYNEACQNYQVFDNQSNPFSDTENNQYCNDIKKASIMGFINGTTSTTYNPQSYIKREDIATIIFRFIKLMYPAEKSSFQGEIADEKDISSYAIEAIQFCMSNKIMNGTGNNQFTPKGLLTRQEAMVLMYNICQHYQIIKNGRESALMTFSNGHSGLHETINDNYIYISFQSYPFVFNGNTENNSEYKLIRTTLDFSKKNMGEILLSRDRIEAYAIAQDKIFFCDRDGVYSIDKNGGNLTKIRDLSIIIGSNDIPQMKVEGNWIFIGAANSVLKLHTDGTCISFLAKGMGSHFKSSGQYLYTTSQNPHTKKYSIQVNRISITGEKAEKIFDYERDNGMMYAFYPEGNIVYLMLYNYDDIDNNTKLFKINGTDKTSEFLQDADGSSGLISYGDDLYLQNITGNQLNMKSITGGANIQINIPPLVRGNIALIYDKYILFLYIDVAQQYTRHYTIYNFETKTYTDIYGNVM